MQQIELGRYYAADRIGSTKAVLFFPPYDQEPSAKLLAYAEEASVSMSHMNR
jgi:hypothetical protein